MKTNLIIVFNVLLLVLGIPKAYSQLTKSKIKKPVEYFNKRTEAEDFRKWIDPHIPVSVSSSDYFSGSDKALKIIMEVINTSTKENKN